MAGAALGVICQCKICQCNLNASPATAGYLAPKAIYFRSGIRQTYGCFTGKYGNPGESHPPHCHPEGVNADGTASPLS